MALLFFKFLTMISNFALFMLLAKVMLQYRTLHYDNKSWASIFHITSLVWLIMRWSFWMCTIIPSMHWNNFSFYLLYWIPTMFEFSSFMVLPLYFAHVLYPKQWSMYYEQVRPWYFGSIAAIILFEIFWSYWIDVAEASSVTNCEVGPHPDDCFHTENSSNAFRFITFICFSFLSTIQYAFGVKILQIDEQTYKKVLSLPRETMGKVNSVLVGSFATRAIYQLFAMNMVYILPDIALEASQGDIPFSVFVAAEFWIYLPTMLIISTITSRSFGNPAVSLTNQSAPVISYFGGYGSIDATEGLIGDDDEIDNGIQLNVINADQEDEAEIIRESLDRYPLKLVDIPQRDKSYRSKQSSGLIPIAPQPKESVLYGNQWLGNSKTSSFHSVSTNSSNSYSNLYHPQFGSAGVVSSMGGSSSLASNHSSHQEVTLYSSYMKQHHLPPLPTNSISGSCPEPGSSLSGKVGSYGGGGGGIASASLTSQGSTPGRPGSYMSKGLSPNRAFRFYDENNGGASSASGNNMSERGDSAFHQNLHEHQDVAASPATSCSSPLPPSQPQSPLLEDRRKRSRTISCDASIPPFPMTDEHFPSSSEHAAAPMVAPVVASNSIIAAPITDRRKARKNVTITVAPPIQQSEPKLQIQTTFEDETESHRRLIANRGANSSHEEPLMTEQSSPSEEGELQEDDDYELQVEPRSPTPIPLNNSGFSTSSSGSKSSQSSNGSNNNHQSRRIRTTSDGVGKYQQQSIDLNTSLSTILSSSQSSQPLYHPSSISIATNVYANPQPLLSNPVVLPSSQSGSSFGLSNISLYFASPPVTMVDFQQQQQQPLSGPAYEQGRNMLQPSEDQHPEEQLPHSFDSMNYSGNHMDMEEGRFYVSSFNPLLPIHQRVASQSQSQSQVQQRSGQVQGPTRPTMQQLLGTTSGNNMGGGSMTNQEETHAQHQHQQLVEIHTCTSQNGQQDTHVVVRNTYSPQLQQHQQTTDGSGTMASVQSVPGIIVTHTVVPKPTRTMTMRSRGMGYDVLPARNSSTGSSDSGHSSNQDLSGHAHGNSIGHSGGDIGSGGGSSQQASPTQFSQISHSWSPSPVFALYSSPFFSSSAMTTGVPQPSTPNGSNRLPLLSSSFNSSPMFSIFSSSPSPHSSNTTNTLFQQQHNHVSRSSSVGPGSTTFSKSVTPERREFAAETRRLRESLNQARPTPPQYSPVDNEETGLV